MSSSGEPTRLMRLLLLFFFCFSIFAQDSITSITVIPSQTPTPTPTPKTPAGLGIKQDKSTPTQFVWSSKLRYDGPVADLFSDDDLYALAKQAWDEMQADIAPRRPKNGVQNSGTITKSNEPGMMGLIAVGNTIYLSSSMKGPKFIYGLEGPNAQVKLALGRCQMALVKEIGDGVKSHHTNKAACAEILALHQYYLDPAVSDADKKTLPAGTRAAAYGDGGVKKRGARPYEPCGNNVEDRTTWGCSQFLGSLNIVAPPLPTGTLTNPTVTPVEITYVPVCGS